MLEAYLTGCLVGLLCGYLYGYRDAVIYLGGRLSPEEAK
jgi:hypothetical protein